MAKYSGVEWHDLSEEEQEQVDNECGHGDLHRDRGFAGMDSGDYYCGYCGIIKSANQWRSEGKSR